MSVDNYIIAKIFYQKFRNKQQLKLWVEEGKIFMSDYKSITGEELKDVSLETLKNNILKAVDLYKHEKATWFEYDGHQQRFLEFDRASMVDYQEGLKDGILLEAEWKYPDAYVTITDYIYFQQMRLTGGLNLKNCFSAEKLIKTDIELMTTTEELLAYDWKTKFEEYLATIKAG